jgi:hypothetical protein
MNCITNVDMMYFSRRHAHYLLVVIYLFSLNGDEAVVDLTLTPAYLQ